VKLLRWPALMVIVSGFAMAVYRWGPHRSTPRWAWIWPGAVLASFVWLLISAGFSAYVDLFAPMRAAYGVFSGVFVLMLWLFLSAYIFLLGAEINVRLEQVCGSEPADKR
jgi:membrane protein